jgi:hypothetical protein
VANPITAERLRELRDYNPQTGQFFYKVKSGCNRAGALCGSHHAQGYVQMNIERRTYLAHRLAWLYVTGNWPAKDVDHIDCDKKNNCLANLRDVSEVVNGHNRKGPNKNNRSSGLIGVKRNKDRWAAGITINRKPSHLGTYDTPEQAHAAYLQAKTKANLSAP